jgi:hypothetical protein
MVVVAAVWLLGAWSVKTENALRSHPNLVGWTICGGKWSLAGPSAPSCNVAPIETAVGTVNEERCESSGAAVLMTSCSQWPVGAVAKTTPLKVLKGGRDGIVAFSSMMVDESLDFPTMVDGRPAWLIGGVVRRNNTDVRMQALLVVDGDMVVQVLLSSQRRVRADKALQEIGFQSLGAVHSQRSRNVDKRDGGRAPAAAARSDIRQPVVSDVAEPDAGDWLSMPMRITRDMAYGDVMSALRAFPCEKSTSGDYLWARFQSPALLAYPDAGGNCVVSFLKARVIRCEGCSSQVFQCD